MWTRKFTERADCNSQSVILVAVQWSHGAKIRSRRGTGGGLGKIYVCAVMIVSPHGPSGQYDRGGGGASGGCEGAWIKVNAEISIPPSLSSGYNLELSAGLDAPAASS